MRQLPPTAPLRRQTTAPAQASAKAVVRRDQPKVLRELDSDELRHVGGGAPKKGW